MPKNRILPAGQLAVVALSVASLLAACQAAAPGVMADGHPVATMTLDHPAFVAAVADKPNVTWQDGLFHSPEINARRKAREYQVKAAAGSITNNLLLPAGAISSSAPAYAHANFNYNGPTPLAGDRIYVITDGGTLYCLNAQTLAVVNSRAGLGAFSGGAVQLSADNHLIYLLTTSGTLLALDSTSPTFNTLSSTVLAGTGFTKTSPFIDYVSSNLGNNAHDNMYVVANDGTINNLYIVTSSGSVSLKTWATGTVGYGGAVSVTNFPIVYARVLYFGDANGNFYSVNTNGAAPVTATWPLAGYTSSAGAALGITAPASYDFDNANNVNALFVPCGDRLVWINPQTGVVTASASLTVDAPGVAPFAGSLATYTPKTTVVNPYTPSDYISIKTATSNPTRWGGSLGNVYNTGVQGTSVKFSASGASGFGEIWTANYTAGTITRLRMDGTPLATYTTATNPNELSIDPSGNAWIACGSGGGTGTLQKYGPTGSPLVSFPLANAQWPQTDGAGNVWVATNASNRVNFYPPGGAGGTATYSDGVNQAFSVAVDGLNNSWTTSYSGGRVYRRSQTNAAAANFAVGTNPAYVSVDALTNNVWVANFNGGGAATMNVLTQAGVAVFPPVSLPSGLWAVNFDNNGNPWTCHLNPSPQLNKLDRLGNVIANYNMSAFGNCYEMCFDANNNGWVATDGGVIEILDLGNLSDIFAGSYYLNPADGDNAYGFMKFKVPKNAYGGRTVLSASLTLTANNTPTANETMSLYTASPYVPGGGTTLWTGYPGTPNVDNTNRPVVAATPFATRSNFPVVKNSAYNFPLSAIYGDQVNSSDAANAEYVIALQSQGKKLASVAHWYSNTSAGATTSNYPTLNVTLATGGTLPAANGIRCQPTVGYNNKVYLSACNALWELDYTSAATFQAVGSTLYNMTQTGRTTGPVTTGATPNYIFPLGNVLFTSDSRVVVVDSNAGAGFALNDFTAPLSASLDRLGYQVAGTPGSGAIGQQMLYDYTSGSAIVTTSNGYVLRASILQ